MALTPTPTLNLPQRGLTPLRVLGALLFVALLVPAGTVGAQPRQSVQATFTTERPGAASGRVENGDFRDPADPGGKPHAASRVVLTLAAGARWDTGAVARCDASDAELMVAGPDACPAASRVGQGPVTVDTGADGPGRDVVLDFTAFNAKDALILVGRERQSGGYLVVRGTVHGGVLQIDFPVAPGTPPEGGALKTERIVFFQRGRYLVTPPSCPASGYWVNRLVYTYRDGVTESVESRSPCTHRLGEADRRPPRIGVRGLPHRCARRSFVVKFKARDASPLRRVRAYLDGRRIASSRHATFHRRIHAERLRAGRHRLRVVAFDAPGNAARRTFRFRACR